MSLFVCTPILISCHCPNLSHFLWPITVGIYPNFDCLSLLKSTPILITYHCPNLPQYWSPITVRIFSILTFLRIFMRIFMRIFFQLNRAPVPRPDETPCTWTSCMDAPSRLWAMGARRAWCSCCGGPTRRRRRPRSTPRNITCSSKSRRLIPQLVHLNSAAYANV